MFCPGCGNENSIEQRFCRVCGLELTAAAASVRSQMPVVPQNDKLAKRTRIVENALAGIGGLFLAGFDVFLIWKIITAIIIGRGEMWTGLLFIVGIVVLSLALCLVVYRQFLLDAAENRVPGKRPRKDIPGIEPIETRRLAEPYFQPAQSVVEPTTELLKTPDNREDS